MSGGGRPGRAAVAAALAALALAGCADTVTLPAIRLPGLGGSAAADDRAQAAPAPAGTAALPAAAAALPAPQPAGPAPDRAVRIRTAVGEVPAIYMALERPRGGPVSPVFAADAGGNGPGDDPAIRLRPENGLCNPEELPSYRFEGRPVFGRAQAAQGVGPAELPEFMAVAVSRAMINSGLARTPEQTRPQNLCTARLWQRLVLGQSRAAAPAGQ